MKRILLLVIFIIIASPALADSTIEGLTAGAAVSATDLFPTVQPTSPAVSVTGAQIKTFTSNGPTFTGTITMPDASTLTSTGYSNVKSLTFAPAANTQPVTISGGSTTGSGTTPLGISVTGTLNTTGVVDGAVLLANVTNTAAGAGTLYVDIKKGGSSVFFIDNFGNTTASGNVNPGGGLFATGSISAGAATLIGFAGRGFMNSPAANTIEFGINDSASPAAQTLKFQNGAGAINISGQNATIIGSLSTGTGTDGDVIFQTGVKNGGSNATPATPTTAMTIKGETQETIFNAPIRMKGYTVSALPTGNQGDRAFVTDQTAACTFLGALTGGGAIFCPVIFNGTAWVGG